MCDKAHYDDLEERVTELEEAVGHLREETRSGFNGINANIETLSQMIANMDKRIIDEKVKWGETLRGIVKWTVRALLATVTYAAGVNLTQSLFPAIFN